MLLLVSFALLFVLSLFLRANTHTHTSFLLSYLRLSYELGESAGDGEGQGNLVQSMVLQRVEHDLATEQQNPHPTLHQNKQTKTVNKNLRELTCPRPYH